MHFVCIVVVPKKVFDNGETAIKIYVEVVMANNNEMFDWYVIGGRWDGYFNENYEPDIENGNFPYDDKYHQISNNCTLIKDIISMYNNNKKQRFVGIVDLECNYHGFDGLTKDEFMDILEKNSHNYAVTIDYHI